VLKPITNPDRYRAKALDSILNATQPAVDGVRIETIPAATKGAGYVKVLIPASDRPPHRAMSADEGRGVARHAGLFCTLGEGKVATTYGGLRDVSAINDGRPIAQYYEPQGVIHPNGIYSTLGTVVLQRDKKDRPLRLMVKWYAEEMMPREVEIEVEPGTKGVVLS